MLSFNINGKDFSNDDVNLLVCHDHIKNITEVKMYCNDEEIQVNDGDSDIEIKINIISDRMNNHTGKTKSLGERLNKLERVIAVIREEMNELRKNYFLYLLKQFGGGFLFAYEYILIFTLLLF